VTIATAKTRRATGIGTLILVLSHSGCGAEAPTASSSAGGAPSTSSDLPYLAQVVNGRLAYKLFANTGEMNAVNVLPDFSHAGYGGGGVALPNVPVRMTIGPRAGDNRQQIQAALDAVSAMAPDSGGFRGALLLTRGRYEVSGPLTINASGVVLRGEGQGEGGTVLVDTLATNHDAFIRISGSGSSLGEIAGTRTPITDGYVATGSRSFSVQPASGLATGDSIVVMRTPNQAWIDELAMGQYGWTASGYAIGHERRITAVSGNQITIDIPIVDPMQARYGGGLVYKSNLTGRISQCGVENLRLESAYASETDEEHAWKAIVLHRATHCWVTDVTARYFAYSAVSIEGRSSFNTVQNTAMLDHRSEVTGGRRYSFNLDDSTGNLFQRCFARSGRHDFVTGSQTPGPNVFLDSLAVQTRDDIGPHHRWATGLLFDNVEGGLMRVQNRGASGSGHGWAGAQTLFWNLQSSRTIKVESPRGGLNWGVGCVGATQEGAGHWERWGQRVDPRSLYLKQLEDRLGQEAVTRVTTAAQRAGPIWSQLAAWAGEGRLP
jgi:hypothetical protein